MGDLAGLGGDAVKWLLCIRRSPDANQAQASSGTLAPEKTSSSICNFLERRSEVPRLVSCFFVLFFFEPVCCCAVEDENMSHVFAFFVVRILQDAFAFGFGCFATDLQADLQRPQVSWNLSRWPSL